MYVGAELSGYDFSLSQATWTTRIAGLLSLFPLVWFARQASRQSLAHAFFLLFIIGGLTLPDLSQSLPLDFRWIWGLAEPLPAVWLLAHFDLRGPTFRRWSVIVIAALEGLTVLRTWIVLQPWTLLSTRDTVVSIEWYTFLYLLPYALVYFVRVRQPAAEVSTAPENEDR